MRGFLADKRGSASYIGFGRPIEEEMNGYEDRE